MSAPVAVNCEEPGIYLKDKDLQMKMRRTLLWILMCLALIAAFSSCGGGGETTPDGNPPLDSGEGGDPPDFDLPDASLNPFAPPGGVYEDIRGIASSRE